MNINVNSLVEEKKKKRAETCSFPGGPLFISEARAPFEIPSCFFDRARDPPFLFVSQPDKRLS